MSEYQHYEFHTIDRPLTSEEMTSIRSMSSRVQLSPRKAIFTYSYSDFRYDEEEVLLKHFDFMLYITNWGTKRMMMKMPLELVDYKFLKKYRISVLADFEQDIRVLKKGKYAILDVSYSEENGSVWIEEGDYGYDLLGIRGEIMEGDYRSLFVIWLRFLEDLYRSDEFDPDFSFVSRLVPFNLHKMTASGYAAKEFYQVNEVWLDVMRSYSGKAAGDSIDYTTKMLNMPKERMIEYLTMILAGEPNLKIRLIKELSAERKEEKKKINFIKLLEVGEKATKVEQARLKLDEEKRAHEESKRMNSILQNKDKIELEITERVKKGNSTNYRAALSKILELKAMHDYFGTTTQLKEFLSQVKSENARKSSFIRMLKQHIL